MITKLRIYIAIGGVALLIGICSAIYWYVSSLAEQNAQLSARLAQMETAYQTQNQTIQSQSTVLIEWQRNQEQFAADLERVATVQREANKEVRELNELFAKIDLDELAREDPEKLRIALDASTDNAWRMLECASSSGGEDCPDRITAPWQTSPPTARPNNDGSGRMGNSGDG